MRVQNHTFAPSGKRLLRPTRFRSEMPVPTPICGIVSAVGVAGDRCAASTAPTVSSAGTAGVFSPVDNDRVSVADSSESVFGSAAGVGPRKINHIVAPTRLTKATPMSTRNGDRSQAARRRRVRDRASASCPSSASFCRCTATALELFDTVRLQKRFRIDVQELGVGFDVALVEYAAREGFQVTAFERVEVALADAR